MGIMQEMTNINTKAMPTMNDFFVGSPMSVELVDRAIRSINALRVHIVHR